MKMLTTAASVLLVVTITRGECVVVAPEVRPSKQNAHATVMVDGKPATRLPIHLMITSLPSGKRSEMRLATDVHGAINLKNLPAGQNCLAADAEPRLTASMCLDVTTTHDRVPTKFPLLLTSFPLGPTLDEMATEHDKSPIELTGPAFGGTVKDPAGSGIAKAQGNFTAPLEPGAYTIVIMSQGFKTRFVGVEIRQDAPKQNMSIELTIGSVC